MYIRTVFVSTLILICAGAALGQRPGPEFWRKVGCEPFEPRTKLEALEDRHSTVVIKGYTRVSLVDVGGIRIDAVEMRELGNVSRAKGLIVVLRSEGERPDDNRAFVDYEEIDSLLNAIDVISRVDESVTKLTGFEARYKTLGDLEISAFRQTRSGNAVMLRTGICNRASLTLSLDEFAKIKAMIQDAKARLDELR